jgi:hypothetical protein
VDIALQSGESGGIRAHSKRFASYNALDRFAGFENLRGPGRILDAN